MPTTSGQAADFALGQLNLTSNSPNSGGINESSLRVPITVHSDGTHLFVADNYNSRVLVWNSFPNANGAAADSVIGQPDFTSGAANRGGAIGNSTLKSLFSLYSDGNQIFVSDAGLQGHFFESLANL